MEKNNDYYLIGFNAKLADNVAKNKKVQAVLSALDKEFSWKPIFPEQSVLNGDIFDEIDRILPIIFDIVRRHNVTLGEEYYLTEPGSANKFNGEAIRRTVKDVSLFREYGKKAVPIKVYSAVYGDVADLYENVLIKKLTFAIYGILRYGLTSLLTAVKTVNYDGNATSAAENVVPLNKNPKIIESLKSVRRNIRKCRYLIADEFIASIKGGNPRDDFVLRANNAIKNDKRYFRCFEALKTLKTAVGDFFKVEDGKKNYVNYSVAFLLNYLISQGFTVKNDGVNIFRIADGALSFNNLEMSDRKTTFVFSLAKTALSIKRTVSCARTYSDENARFISSYCRCVFSRDAGDEFFESDDNSGETFVFSEDIRPLEVPDSVFFSPYALSSYENLISFVKKLILYPCGNMEIYAYLCPVCKSFHVEEKNGGFECLNCGNRYVPYLAPDGTQSIFIETLSKVF